MAEKKKPQGAAAIPADDKKKALETAFSKLYDEKNKIFKLFSLFYAHLASRFLYFSTKK